MYYIKAENFFVKCLFRALYHLGKNLSKRNEPSGVPSAFATNLIFNFCISFGFASLTDD